MRSRLLIHTTAWWCLMGALLFAGAGTLRWAAAWIYLAEMEVISLMLGAWLARHDPALLDERMKFPVRRKQPGWDRVLMSIFMLLFLGWLALMGVGCETPGMVADARVGTSRRSSGNSALQCGDLAGLQGE
jgi:hypothetical protein